MLNPHQYINLILEPSLKAIDMYSLDAMYLMACTVLVESKLTHLRQLPNGIALSLWQIEPTTYDDVLRYLNRRSDIRSKVLNYCERTYMPFNPLNLVADLNLSTMVARVKYWMIPAPIPSYKDPQAQAEYYERYYNCNREVNKVAEFVQHSQNITGWINHGTKEQGNM